jgi:hypothetical protein
VVPPSGKKLKYVNIPATKHGASSAHNIRNCWTEMLARSLGHILRLEKIWSKWRNFFFGHLFSKYHIFVSVLTTPKVECSGERLRVCLKNLRILKIFSSYTLIKTRKIPWDTPNIWTTIWGASWSSTSLYQFIRRKCFQNPQIFASNPHSFSRAIYFINDCKISEY